MNPQAALLVLATMGLGLVGQRPTFSSRTDVVRLDVLVTDGRRPVTGLQASDFEILDEGVRQQIDHVSFEEMPLNVVMVFDTSGSMSAERLTHVLGAGRAVCDSLTPADRAALVTFGTTVSVRSTLTGDLTGVREALAHAVVGGETSLIDASYGGLVIGDSDAGRSVVIIFSDGGDTSSFLSAESVLTTARRTNDVVYGVTQLAGERVRFVRDLTRATGGRVLNIDSTKELEAALLQILVEFRHRYLLSFTPRRVTRTGWHKLDVRVKNGNFVVNARPGYEGGG